MIKIFVQSLALICFFFSSSLVFAEEKRMFTVTGYYSPLPNQDFYVTGSYKSDLRLNGHGIKGADGTSVFPGMIAAPSSYAFGTKICLPNFGCGAVHDRGGAIVKKGKRPLAKHDRLDLWLGYGEEGLSRALSLGVWQVEGTIYGSDNENVAVGVNFKGAHPISRILDISYRKVYTKNLRRGLRGPEVEELQRDLLLLGFYEGAIDGFYSHQLKASVLAFQESEFIVESKDSEGAGVFGPKTRLALADILYQKEVERQMLERWGKFEFEDNLKRGERDFSVWRLQEILIQEEILEHVPTGYFGELTELALKDFQIKKGIIKRKSDRGAGNVGPKTRLALNALLASEKVIKKEEAEMFLLKKKQERQRLAFMGQSSRKIVKK